MNALTTDFDALAQGAAFCAEWGGSFVLYTDGNPDDSYDTLEGVADAYADCWNDFASVKVMEFAPSGAATDVTAEVRGQIEEWCHSRFVAAPWGMSA